MDVAEGRQQFTFYRSFWEAVNGLEKKDKLPVLTGIIEYALDGKLPSGLTKTQNAFFLLTKPTLDASRKKAENGKHGGSKPKANSKQTPSKKEKEKEEEKENEIEGEYDKQHPRSKELFSSFWDSYPAVGRGDREEAEADWEALELDEAGMREVLRKLEAWKASKRWTEDGGAYIPNISNFLDPKRQYIHAAPGGASVPGYGGWKPSLGAAELNSIRRVLDEDEVAAVHRMMEEA